MYLLMRRVLMCYSLRFQQSHNIMRRTYLLLDRFSHNTRQFVVLLWFICSERGSLAHTFVVLLWFICSEIGSLAHTFVVLLLVHL